MGYKQPSVGKKERLVNPGQDRLLIPWKQVNITTYFAGMEMKGSDSFNVAFDDWKAWRKGEQGYVYFPSGTAIEITIENNSGQDIINPTLRIVLFWGHMDDNVTLDVEGLTGEADNEFFYRKDRIVAGGKTRYQLPLERACAYNESDWCWHWVPS